jgi:hypothetical protein
MKVIILSATLLISLISYAFCGETKGAAPYGSVKWTNVGGSSPKDFAEATCPKGYQTQYGGKNKPSEVAIYIKDNRGNAAWLYCKDEKTRKVATVNIEVFN